AIIDVRDSDYIGGHIRGCTNVPAHSLDWRAPELARTLRDVPLVVFHCALSQQRGPGAALRYLRERERLAPDDEGAVKEQDVKVLEGGFVRWQEKYGKDSSVTEGYVEDIWKYGY
ncbi:Rhodanese-like domain-containing protein, partial [Phyllosticta citribraziliensis]